MKEINIYQDMKHTNTYQEVALVNMFDGERQLYVNGAFEGGNAFDMTDEELRLKSQSFAKQHGVEVKVINYLIPHLTDSEKEMEYETLSHKGVINRSQNRASVEAVAKMIVLTKEFDVEFNQLDTDLTPFISAIKEQLRQLDDEKDIEDKQRLAFYMTGESPKAVFENIFNGLVYDDFDVLWFALEDLFKAENGFLSFMEIRNRLKLHLKQLRSGIEALAPV